jgi:hypothetical protein
MKPYNVYRFGSMWYYAINGAQSTPFESRDAAEAAAQKAVIEQRKSEAEKTKEESVKEEKKAIAKDDRRSS